MKRPTPTSNRPLRLHDEGILKTLSGPLCGVDEVGRGPLAGPVVACAVVVKDFGFTERIDDSKKLAPLQRDRAYDEILKKCSVSLAVIDEKRIDEVNIYRAALEAMTQAVQSLDEKPELLLVDGIAQPAVACNVRCIPGGDARSFSIACASITAKVFRDRLMHAYHGVYPKYGFDQHKGYGTARHLTALRTHGPCAIHRRSFAPVGLQSSETTSLRDQDTSLRGREAAEAI